MLRECVLCAFWLRNVLRAATACTFSTSQLHKVVWTWCVLYILTWKRASSHSGLHFSNISVWFVHFDLEMCFAHNGVHFFNISASKSGPNMRCFVHFDFEVFFAPQRRALFRHLNFQKCSGHGALCAFWLGNVIHGTNGVQFFISHLATWLRTRRFSEPTFRPSGATNHWKNTVFRDFFYIFARLHLLSSHSFSALIFSLLLFSSLTLPTSAFPSVHTVGSLTSKLPSINVEVLLPKSERFPSLSNYIKSCCVLGAPHQPQPFSFGWSFNLWRLSD